MRGLTKIQLPRVSIITPSYNQAEFLEETIHSVAEQDYPNIEHIIIDGGSTDGSLDILKRHPQVIVRSGPDRGQADAVNKGFALASGEFFGWLNSDDTYLPGAISVAVDALADADIVYGRCRFIDEAGNYLGHFRTRPFEYAALTRWDFVAQPTVFFRRSVFEESGGLDLNYRCAMDYEFWLRVMRGRNVVNLERDLATYRVHASAKTTADFARMALEAHSLRRRYGASQALCVAMLGKELAGGWLRTSRLGLALTMYLKRRPRK